MTDIPLHRGISVHRIGAMILRYWYLLLSSWPRLLELLYWPALQVITWGFIQYYIAENSNFFARAGELNLKHARLTAFGSTRFAKNPVEEDRNVRALVEEADGKPVRVR